VNEARDMCFSLSNVICSYTCKNIEKVKKKKKNSLDIREIGQHLSPLSAVSAKKACKNKLKAKNEWRFSLD
jgi:hypothetical protein